MSSNGRLSVSQFPVALGAGFAFLILSCPGVRAQEKFSALEISAIRALQKLIKAELSYNSLFPDHGYACSMSALGGRSQSGTSTPDAAHLISGALGTGRSDGYKFVIAQCTMVVVHGNKIATGYKLFAVPEDAGKTLKRGFCTDENAIISFDPAGGTNCTERVE